MPALPLRIADDLSLPLDAALQTFAILARKGAGKTYFAAVLCEELVKAGVPLIFVDPVGVGWGLRASADGKGPGLPVVVLGGEHGDVPLEVGAGETIARMLVQERFAAVLDLSLMRKGEAIRFMTPFCETLYHRNREPVHLVLDEADQWAPQRTLRGEGAERLLGAVEDLVRRGRARGIGVSLLTQRAAVLNKNILTQAAVLLALQTISPQDRAAVDEWVKVHGTPGEREELMRSLPALPVGTAWIWSPPWDLFQRIKIRRRETFDSSATPKVGQKTQTPKQLAAIDIDRLREHLAATVEKAKAEDPRELQRQIRELQQRLTVAEKRASQPSAPQIERVDVPVVSNEALERLEAVVDRLAAIQGEAGGAVREVAEALRNGHIRAKAAQLAPLARPAARPQTVERPAAAAVQPRQARGDARPQPAAAGTLTGPEQRILDAVAWMEAIGIAQPQQTAVAFLAGYKIGGGAFNNPRGSLRGKGLVEYFAGERIGLTDAGRAHANHPDAPLTAEELQRRVLERLPGPEQRILKPLLKAYPDGLTNADLAEAAGYSDGGGAYNNPRGRLRTLGLIEYRTPLVLAAPVLFLEN